MEPSAHGSVPIDLTECQRRHLCVFLDHVEGAVAEVMWLAELEPVQRTLTIDQADLPPGFSARISPELERIRQAIGTLAARFGLEPERRSRLRRVQALLLGAVVQIDDAGSRSLRAYGSVEPGLPLQLDPVLDDIGDALGAMISALLAS